VQYAYPSYGINLTHEMMQKSCDIVVRLLDEVGFNVPHDPFLSHLRGKAGVRIDGQRVHFAPSLTQKYLDRFIAGELPIQPSREMERFKTPEWEVYTAGYAMMVLDLETEEIRPSTCQDLRDMIKLANSFGVGGMYPIMPQDLPPLMRDIACFKICWEMSQNIQPITYQQPEQARYAYEMYCVMGKPFRIELSVPTTMTLDPTDVSTFLALYPEFKKNKNFSFVPLCYTMLGILKPVTAIGCATMQLAETLGVHMLFNLFDPEINVRVGMQAGNPTDLRHVCWAWGSPRRHLFNYLNAQILPRLRGEAPERYTATSALLETSSSAVDEQAALEKMAVGLTAALQGCRTFQNAGTLCVDDLFSGTQFVIDMEIVSYIREVVESFNPHPDILNMEGLYEECRDVALGNETFISHPNTARRCRNIVPSSNRIVREKLRAFMAHRKTLKDRAREEALERIRTFEPYHLPDDKQKELDKIYARAEAELGK